MSRLLDAAGSAPFVFVVGKGGVGKTTTAGAIALELADSGLATHLISTDPAHSLGDLFQQSTGAAAVVSACSPGLLLEEFAAAHAAHAWLERSLGAVSQIVERGTYLDADDVAAFSRLALPGVDEMMAVLRLADLAVEDARVVVDTAPTGHTLRLLDAAATHEGIARALRAMADKAAAVAGAMTGKALRLSGERFIDELEGAVARYRERVLAPAAFLVVTRPGRVVAAETDRLLRALEARSLHVAAIVATAGAGESFADGAAQLEVPRLEEVTGCSGLRRLRRHVQLRHSTTSGPGPVPQGGGGDGAQWLADRAPRLLFFAGKGGVGKSTCAAAAALALAASRDVLLCSTDPAGSLDDVLDLPAPPQPRLRVMQIDPAAQLTRLHDSYQAEITAALDRLGLARSAELDRRVIEALWDLAPPGLDEMAAMAVMLHSAAETETVVIDSAPTGHFLRLLEMPELALGWTRQLMRVIVKYGITGVTGGAAESLLELARQLKSLDLALHDAGTTAVIVVTRDEPMVQAETERLIATLSDASIRLAAVLINGASIAAAAQASAGRTLLIAPAVEPPPVGADALRGFIDEWNIVT